MNLNSKTTGARRGFTLIELLTVISIIAVLAALLIPALSSLSKRKYITTAQAELGQIQAAIDSYHAKYGSYPPSSANGVLLHQLFYELSGTTYNPVNKTYTTLDGQYIVLAADLNTVFGVAGIVNCSKGSGEDAAPARNFLLGLKPGMIGTNSAGTGGVAFLMTSLRGLDPTYTPLGANTIDVNPFRYNSVNPTNNPGTYDLWIDLPISHKTNRISNWSRQVQTVQ